MKLFHRLHLIAVIAGFTLASSTALADPRNHGNNARFSSNSYKGGWNKSTHWNRHKAGRNDYRGNRAYTFQGNQFKSNYRSRPAYRHTRHHDNWSVSFNIGSGYSRWANAGAHSRLQTGFFANNFRRYYPTRNATRVIVKQPTVVYVNEAPVTTRVVSTTSRPQRSLLRDIHGNCFERTTDSRGNETRVQLSDYECNF